MICSKGLRKGPAHLKTAGDTGTTTSKFSTSFGEWVDGPPPIACPGGTLEPRAQYLPQNKFGERPLCPCIFPDRANQQLCSYAARSSVTVQIRSFSGHRERIL